MWQPSVCVQSTPCYKHCAPTNDTYCNKCLLFYNETRQISSLSAHVLLSKTANPITFMWEEEDSKPIQKFYIAGVPHIVNRSYWRTFHILTPPPSSVNEQVITITACILSPSSAHAHDLYAAMALKPQWCVLTHIFVSHIYYHYKYGKQVTKATIVMVLYLNMAENVKCY